MNLLYSCYQFLKFAETKFKSEDIPDLHKQKLVSQNNPSDVLMKYFNEENIFIHFSKVNRPEIYYAQNWDTPFGLYGYVLDKTLFTHPDDFAKDRKYIHIFKALGRGLIFSKYSEEDFNRDLNILKSKYNSNDEKDIINKGITTAKDNKPITKIWNVTRLLAKENIRGWSRIFQNDLNYSFANDYGLALIGAESSQIVVFPNSNNKNYQFLETIENKKNTFAEFEKSAVTYLVETQKIDIEDATPEFKAKFFAKMLDDNIPNAESKYNHHKYWIWLLKYVKINDNFIDKYLDNFKYLNTFNIQYVFKFLLDNKSITEKSLIKILSKFPEQNNPDFIANNINYSNIKLSNDFLSKFMYLENNYFVLNNIAKFQKLSINFIKKHISELPCNIIMNNQKIDNNIVKYYIDEKKISQKDIDKQILPVLPESNSLFFDNTKDFINWKEFSKYIYGNYKYCKNNHKCDINCIDKIVQKYFNKIDWDVVSSITMDFSKDFIYNYKNKFNMDLFKINQPIENFILLSEYKNVATDDLYKELITPDISYSTLKQFSDKLDWKLISKICNLPIITIYEFQNKIDFDLLHENPSPNIKKILEKYPSIYYAIIIQGILTKNYNPIEKYKNNIDFNLLINLLNNNNTYGYIQGAFGIKYIIDNYYDKINWNNIDFSKMHPDLFNQYIKYMNLNSNMPPLISFIVAANDMNELDLSKENWLNLSKKINFNDPDITGFLNKFQTKLNWSYICEFSKFSKNDEINNEILSIFLNYIDWSALSKNISCPNYIKKINSKDDFKLSPYFDK